MKITKYPQSCFLIEMSGKKILVDPGGLSFDEKFLSAWEKADCIFITHKHGDHAYKPFLEKFDKPIYSTQEVQEAFPTVKMNIIKAGDKVDLDNVKVQVLKSIHGYLPRLTNNNLEIEEAVGFMFEAEGKKIYHMGDSVCFKTNAEHECDVLLTPVSGHGLVMGPHEVSELVKEIKNPLVIPMHMDNPAFPVNINDMKKKFDEENVSHQILGFEESIEV